MVNWTRRDVVIDSSDDVTLSPENLQHVLTIRNADISDSGDYVCYIVDFPLLINRTIRLNVLQGKCKIRPHIYACNLIKHVV